MKATRRWPEGKWSEDRLDAAWQWQRHRRGRFLFLRFATLFGLMVLLVLGGMAAAAFLLNRLFGGDGQTAVLVWLAGCGLAITLPFLAALMARRAFRGITTPLAEVMSAADALAEGDFSVRVPERRGGDFGQLARSFNRMAQELEQAEQQRRSLTADVAHELRTPLQIIQGNLEGILDGVYEPTTEHVAATLEETHLLSRLVEDLRTLSLAESGQLELVLEQVDVAELLSDVQTSFSGQAEAAGIRLETQIDVQWPLAVVADVGRLDQVLGNLVVNALRHTPRGGTIWLTAGRLEGGGVRLRVRDNGEGIAAEDLPLIFDRFWRGDRSRSHSGGSVGLGLAIAQQLVKAQGGRIGVESQPAQGTIFTIDLPGDGSQG